jgi:cell division transport system permease protein
LASISCITITLVIVGLSIISSYNVDNFAKLIQKDFTVIVYLDNDITSDETKQIANIMEEDKNISEYKFKSKIETANSFMESSDVFKSIMQDWDEKDNPLKDTYLIKVKDATKITATAKKIEKLDNVYDVQYGKEIIDKLLTVFDVAEKVLVAIVLLLIIVTAFLIANTIKLTIFSRKREIEIMRLVGASNFNIELPFIVEGLLLGLLGSLIPMGIVIYGYSALYPHFNGQIISPFMRLVQPEPFIYIVSIILLGIGILVGMFGSLRAVRKYLKI